ncbi:MAG TPA: acylphosphatase [Dehalococcoidia bacterium]|nr:acylphosphatase [Dehalococcoidia bacterium]
MKNRDLASLRVIVSGDVQGVFFRAYAARLARGLGLTGYTQNLPRGDSVEVIAEGERRQLEELISHLRVGPPAAKVEDVTASWSEYTGIYSEFSIRF